MNYKIIIDNKKRYITIPKLTQLGLKHCFTTRDMDMGIRTNPSIGDLKQNLRQINKILEIKPEVLFRGVQTHSNHVANILELTQGKESEIGLHSHYII